MSNDQKKTAVILLLICSLLFSGCSSVFVKSGKLYSVNSASESDSRYMQIVVDEYSDVINGTLLYYDQINSVGLYTTRQIEDGNMLYYLYLLDDDGSHLLFSGANVYTEGYVDLSCDSVIFKEHNVENNSVTIYAADTQATRKLKLTDAFTDRTLVWCGDGRSIYYINSSNVLVHTDGENIQEVHTFDPSINVRRLFSMSTKNSVIFTASGTQGNVILYRLYLDTDEISTIDGNIGEFECSDALGLVVYTKSAGGHEQLYLYNTNTFLRTYLTTSDISKIALSTSGSYVAYATDITTDLPSQSIWLINTRGDTPAQLTANTTIQGSMVFTGPDTLLFTLSSPGDTSGESIYMIKKLHFTLGFADVKNRGGQE